MEPARVPREAPSRLPRAEHSFPSPRSQPRSQTRALPATVSFAVLLTMVPRLSTVATH